MGRRTHGGAGLFLGGRAWLQNVGEAAFQVAEEEAGLEAAHRPSHRPPSTRKARHLHHTTAEAAQRRQRQHGG